MLVQDHILPSSSSYLSLRAFVVLMCFTGTCFWSQKEDLSYRGKKMANVLLTSITVLQRVVTEMQIQASGGETEVWRAVAIPVAGYVCRKSAGKNEGHQVRLIKANLVSWGLQWNCGVSPFISDKQIRTACSCISLLLTWLVVNSNTS